MPRKAEGRNRGYLLGFGVTAGLLVAGTLVLVLYVLPERYVLDSGFRESGMSFPTPTTPFVPVPVVHMAARPLPEPEPVVAPGPAEIFWAELPPMLRQQRYGQAIIRFRVYLRDYPGDRDARREYAITLLTAGRAPEAVAELRLLLEGGDDFTQRLLLARTLRDLARMDEAADQYATLVEARPEDTELPLEWARAHAWIEEYDRAATVLDDALARHPDSTPLKIELARVAFSSEGPATAGVLLAGLDERELAAADALALRDEVLAALAEPVVEVEPPTPLEIALAAREDDDFDLALAVLEGALAERPNDREMWQAYADLLEYELGDFEGARNALLEVERLGPDDARLQHRLAQLEIWTGRTTEAQRRLLALLPLVASDPDAAAPLTEAEVQAMLGDLQRWDGDRVAAAERYELALASDPGNERAADGLTVMQDELSRTLVELERPRLGATSYAATDTDDFTRLDVGAEWVELAEEWSWGGSAGSRRLDGRTLDGVPAEAQQGVYLDLEAARWWRWGSMRSGARFGVERVVQDWEYSVGASLTLRGGNGSRTELGYDHGPAYPVTATLQSATAGVVQDQVSIGHASRIGVRWTLNATASGARLRTDLDSIPATGNGATTRLQTGLSLGREISRSLTLGVSANAMGYSSAAPVVASTATSTEQRLFWDPKLSVSAGPFARVEHELSTTLGVTAVVGPGIALLDERTAPGWNVVPHLSAETALVHEGGRLSTALELFFYQGRFDGYRMYGARLSVSARDLSRLGGQT